MTPFTAVPIVALDDVDAASAFATARGVAEHCRFFKVGSVLYTASGPDFVRRLRAELGAEVFLDLKFHDIPNTVAGAVCSARGLGVRLLTVHASGGAEMLAAAQDAAGDGCGVLGVTVLTSHSAESLAASWGRAPLRVEDEVLRLSDAAAEAGLHGVVCSGQEAAAVRARHGGALALLVPGIRLAGGAAHDQRRVMTPAAAQAAGARYLILGRAVTAAPHPGEALAAVLAELAAGAGVGG